MATTFYTPEQIKKLKEHPAVSIVNKHFMRFTPEFKEWFYQEAQSGKQTKRILQNAGFDEGVIPKCRYRSIRAHIMQWKAEQRAKKVDEALPTNAFTYELAVADAKILRLEQELKRTSQELEFVKKIIRSGKKE